MLVVTYDGLAIMILVSLLGDAFKLLTVWQTTHCLLVLDGAVKLLTGWQTTHCLLVLDGADKLLTWWQTTHCLLDGSFQLTTLYLLDGADDLVPFICGVIAETIVTRELRPTFPRWCLIFDN